MRGSGQGLSVLRKWPAGLQYGGFRVAIALPTRNGTSHIPAKPLPTAWLGAHGTAANDSVLALFAYGVTSTPATLPLSALTRQRKCRVCSWPLAAPSVKRPLK